MTYKISVYKLFWDDNEDIYIGSTRTSICARVAQHRSSLNHSWMTSSLARAIQQHGADNIRYVLIRSYQVTCKDEQLRYEQRWIHKMKPNLNMKKAHLTPEEKLDYNKKQGKKKSDKFKGMSVSCHCRGRYNINFKGSVKVHMKSKRHQQFVESIRKKLID